MTARGDEQNEARRIFGSLTRIGALFLVLWCCFFVLWKSLPHVTTGHRQIYDEKLDIVARGPREIELAVRQSVGITGARRSESD